ncbi:hypothetical protein BTHE68_48050 [Burkholderia sp. THE68]|uniref:hypothetical protein n=1 Tax=Burkholderia sp. THE68 TaxID=758782 RepID=UPI0013184448|nr:hypothetical protein [Burkholderia sp. THE68]BBU31071.1 hypothetical protein BTHE68_48050 [Burkholderia sp. THE68]
MRALTILLALLAIPALALADAVSTSNNNSTLTVTRDDPIYNLNLPSDPVQLVRTLEWNVDGRRILIYPSGPSTFIDLGHMHADAHVTTNQIHAQGPILGYGTGALSGTVLGGIVYTVDGDTAGTLKSRLTEKVDIQNKSNAPVQLWMSGLGYKPSQSNLEVPDYSGLDIVGTTVAVITNRSITEILPAPQNSFGEVTIFPVVSFVGFNPLINQSVTIPPGATLSMISEIKVSRTSSQIQQFLRENAPSRFQDSPLLNNPFIRVP